MTIKTLIIRAPGTNCELETQATFELAGSSTVILPLYNILKKPIIIHDFHIIVFPGGFSFGDYLGSGTIFALKLQKIRRNIISFLEKKKMILGFCNGFQILVRAGFLPDWTQNKISEFQGFRLQSLGSLNNNITLTFNESGKFEARWVKLKIINKKYDYIKSMRKKYISLPVAHGEGRFISCDDVVIKGLYKNNQVLFEYSDNKYPYNPNGSMSNIAGICCPYGQVIGIMPHPERFHNVFLYPHWQEKVSMFQGLKVSSLMPDGLLFIRSIINKLKC